MYSLRSKCRSVPGQVRTRRKSIASAAASSGEPCPLASPEAGRLAPRGEADLSLAGPQRPPERRTR
jgi:hypothetical protein